jgi:V/A-type H+-transporting ATPase subunit D
MGGRRDLRLAAPAELARVTVRWSNVMGIRYPEEATCVAPEPLPEARGPGSAALVEAAATYREALAAAAAYAAAEAAQSIVAAEIAATRRRLHAITDRWLPRLETALHDRVAQLEENERAETARLRWASGRRSQVALGRRLSWVIPGLLPMLSPGRAYLQIGSVGDR